ncbi:PepSY domain-containing protein [Streptomyces pathocidini]|uniref:PepSY domain-containing protein n=1 Tax=Streptomyces pathocidini TaxID=1650571 RepID=A0ABW7UNP0_9ACTN|nr:PepSY domain-containing protein [Streptomyces pathocidini]
MPAFRTDVRVRACVFGLTAATLLTGLTGCINSGAGTSDSVGSEPRAWDRQPSTEVTGLPTPDATPKSVVNALKAMNTADLAVPRGATYAIEGERDARGHRVWEVSVASKRDGQDAYTDEYDLTVSEDGSRVLTKRQDLTPDDDVAKLRYAKSTAEQAVQLAYNQRPGELDSLETDTRAADGRIVWQVTMAEPGAGDDDGGTEVVIDAVKGTVLRPDGSDADGSGVEGSDADGSGGGGSDADGSGVDGSGDGGSGAGGSGPDGSGVDGSGA